MHSLLPLLTAALLAGHAFVGCCWQGHDSHSADCVACEVEASATRGCCQHGAPASAPCPCRVECQKLCQYVAPERIDSVVELAPVAFVAILPPTWTVSLACERISEGRPPSGLDPQRIQLQHQILLI